MMCTFIVVGVIFLFACFTSLPFLLISPAGFNLYFSLSSASFLIAVAFFYGPCNYLQRLFCNWSTLPITLLYIGSTLGALYCSIVIQVGYLYNLGLIGLQAFSIFFFIFQAWTSGERAQQELKNQVVLKLGSGLSKNLESEVSRGFT